MKKGILTLTILSTIIFIFIIILVFRSSSTSLVFQRHGVGNNQFYSIVGVRGNPTEVNIPNYHNELPVRRIDTRAFSSQRRLEVVNFEYDSKIERIQRLAFSNNNNLRIFNLPDSVIYLENHVFNNSHNLNVFNIGKDSNLRYIGGSAFFGTDLKEIRFPDGLVQIGSHAFFLNRNLSIIKNFPRSLTVIGIEAFGETSLSIIYGPEDHIESILIDFEGEIRPYYSKYNYRLV